MSLGLPPICHAVFNSGYWQHNIWNSTSSDAFWMLWGQYVSLVVFLEKWLFGKSVLPHLVERGIVGKITVRYSPHCICIFCHTLTKLPLHFGKGAHFFLCCSGGFPKQTAAQIILQSIRNYFSSTASSSLKQIYFVLYDTESVNVYTSELGRLDS